MHNRNRSGHGQLVSSVVAVSDWRRTSGKRVICEMTASGSYEKILVTVAIGVGAPA
jgi:hypothetical protein